MPLTKKSFFQSWSQQSQLSYFDLKGVNEDSYQTQWGHVYELSSVSFQCSFGLQNKKITQAIQNQAQEWSFAFPKAHHPLMEEVSQKLGSYFPKGKFFYTLSGAEGIENSIKISKVLQAKRGLLSFTPCYHGATIAASSLTQDWRRDPSFCLKEDYFSLPHPHFDPSGSQLTQFFKTHGDSIGCVFLESVSGGNGVYAPPSSWIKVFNQLKKQYGFFLALDEVVSGFGRLGTAFATRKFPELNPDLVILAKAMTGGLIPFGAVWVKDALAQHFDRHILKCGLTNYAHPMGLAATKATIDVMEETINDEAFLKIQELLSSFLEDLEKLNGIKETRQVGLLAAIDCQKLPKVDEFWKRGLSLILRDNRIILAPFLNAKVTDLETKLNTLQEILHEQTR